MQVEFRIMKREYQLPDQQQPQPMQISNQQKEIYDIFEYYFKRKTIENCLYSLFGQCLECQTFYKPSLNKNQCILKCDDGIVIENEICDDQNNIQYDDCYKCQLSCQLECNYCIQKQCYSCIDGWQLIDQKMLSNLWDGLLAISSLEQCDDGNYQPQDGWYNCKLEFNSYCFQCDSTNTCLLCVENLEQNEKINVNQYVEMKLLYKDEKSVNTKMIFNFMDVINVTFNALKIVCARNVMKDIIQLKKNVKNQQSMILMKIMKSLQSICRKMWRWKLINLEEFDDGNYYNGNGCSSYCIIEENWKCNKDSPNSCFLQTNIPQNVKIKHLNINLFYQSSNEAKLVSNLNFTQSIQININIKQQLTLYDFSRQYYYSGYQFNLFYYGFVRNHNFSISLHSSLVDNNNMPVNLPSQSLFLKTPKIINQNQINNIANKFQNLGNILIIGLGAISILMLLFKQPLPCFEIFDLLQFQSYLKFLNVNYPLNLQIYFNLQKLQQLSQFQYTLQKQIFLIIQLLRTSFQVQVSFKNIKQMLTYIQIFRVNSLKLPSLVCCTYFYKFIQKS
ncbi:unnamed protein product [Paramecium octaurelia]|uniref:Transmembrane protein n=1 Tax=Paramecium octaurelia TaxID=43137 RepID=A0A8S1Y6N8_PAROT|nr:unnamed protein product [Paramecium octaurelia]